MGNDMKKTPNRRGAPTARPIHATDPRRGAIHCAQYQRTTGSGVMNHAPTNTGRAVGAPLQVGLLFLCALFFFGCDHPEKVDIGELVEALNALDADASVDADGTEIDIIDKGTSDDEDCCVTDPGDFEYPVVDDAVVADEDVVEAEDDLLTETEVEDDVVPESESVVEDDLVIIDDSVVPDEDTVETFFIDGLVAWWKLDGNGEDFIGPYDTFTGTGYTFYSETRSGAGQSANGSAVYDVSMDDIVTANAGFTISTWVYYTKSDSYLNGFLTWTSGVSSSDEGSSVYFDGNGSRVYENGVQQIDYSHNRNAGQWYHYVWTYDAGAFELYIDNELRDLGSVPFTTHYVAKFVIGQTYGSPDHTSDEARIDDVMLFDRALSSQELLGLFELGRNGYQGSELVHKEVLPSSVCSGQIKCYNNTSETLCPPEGNDFYGQDGMYAAMGYCVPRSYTVSGVVPEEIVIDNNTGLEWQRTLPATYDGCTGGTCKWQEAIDYCSNLTYGGETDWRLPTRKELATLPDYGRENPAIDTAIFPDTQPGGYWSSSSNVNGTTDAWLVDFNVGSVSHSGKTNDNYARCVRGSALPVSSFTETTMASKVIVTDTEMRLIWTKEYSGQITWQNALSYCENLSYGGATDWRLPNIDELKTLIDDTIYAPASTFPEMPSSFSFYFWSSSSYVPYTTYAWAVPFYEGNVQLYDKSGTIYARCVRDATLTRTTKQWGTSQTEYGRSVAIDSNGNIFVTGHTGGDLDGNTNAGNGYDIFLTKWNANGTKAWTKE
ncbi:MAG TPA: DUF1566 domain-containing protein, partial [bacterium]|nr:DUF1566 domain-containing protein [bacterium]